MIAGRTRLFDAIGIVAKHGYVLVRGEDRKITGIVTVTDLTDQLGQFAGPFLFLGEIEGHLRNLIHGKFTLDELREASKLERPVEGSSDLTFGEFCRLLENADNWAVGSEESVRFVDKQLVELGVDPFQGATKTACRAGQYPCERVPPPGAAQTDASGVDLPAIAH